MVKQEFKQPVTRQKWIDFAKFTAIIAVIVDHTSKRLLFNQYIEYWSYFSVSLFVIITGITTYWSFQRRKIVSKKIFNIIRQYLIASFIYCLAAYKGFNLSYYIDQTIHFKASPPFYYISLYLQLVLISPFLFSYLETSEKKRKPFLYEVLLIPIFILISYLCVNYTNLLNIYGGGGKLFGGTYLLLFYIGMLFAKYEKRIVMKKRQYIFVFIFFLILTLIWWQFITIDKLHIDTYFPFGRGFNPPSISFSTYALLMLLMIYFGKEIVENFGNTNMIKGCFSKLSELGKHTLYIFLYHRLFLDFIIPEILTYTNLSIENIWLKRFVYFFIMIAGSITIEFIFENIHKKMVQYYKGFS